MISYDIYFGPYRTFYILDAHTEVKHHNDVIMSAKASQITNPTSVYYIVDSGTAERKYQSSAALAFMRGIHRLQVHSPHKRASNAEKVSIWWHHHEKGRGWIKK